jgi:hypothetical protein
MRGKAFTYEMNGRTFLGGAQKTNGGEELPDPPYEDEYDNPIWEKKNGVWIAANLAPTAQQLSDAQDKAFVDKVAPIFFKLLKQAIKTTSTPAESWKALDVAIRAQMNGG